MRSHYMITVCRSPFKYQSYKNYTKTIINITRSKQTMFTQSLAGVHTIARNIWCYKMCLIDRLLQLLLQHT